MAATRELIAEIVGAEEHETVADACARILASRAIGRPSPGSDPAEPDVATWWLLTMAAHTARGAPFAPDPNLVARFASSIFMPHADESLGQLAIDPASAIRRAMAVASVLDPDDPVLAVGDDDAVSVALRQLGMREVSAVDLDARVLRALETHGVATHRADVLRSSVPEVLRGRFAAVITDPYRDVDGGLGFLCYGAACLRAEPAGHLFWADSPDWNFEHAQVRAALERLGFAVEETSQNFTAIRSTPRASRRHRSSRAPRRSST